MVPRWLLLALLVGLPAAAAEPAPTGRVRGKVDLVVGTTGAEARRDASPVVVYLTGFDEPPPDAVPELRQKGRQFQPPLLAITAGQAVSFPNGDPFFHNVFSLSPARRFDLGQFRQGESKDKVFTRSGVVEIYCNIHPEMAATLLVLPNRRFAVADADGNFVIDGVPAGTWPIFAYHRLAPRPARAEVAVAAGGDAVAPPLALEIDPARAPENVAHRNKYGEMQPK